MSRGIYHETAAGKHDMVLHQDHRGSWRIDLVTSTGGNHTDITGPNRGYSSAEEAFQAALDAQRVRGIRGKSHVYAADREGNLSDYEPMERNGRAIAVDADAARELDLYIANTWELVGAPNSIGKSIDDGLKRKIANGKYDSSLAVKAWQHLVDEGAKCYRRELGSGSPIFNAATRRHVAVAFAREWESQNTQPPSAKPVHAQQLTGPNLYAEAAKVPASGRFHSQVFLAPLLERFGTTPQAARQKLLDLHRAEEIVLSRADLVDAMDPDLVRRSAIDIGNYTYHFLSPSHDHWQPNARRIPESLQRYSDFSNDELYDELRSKGYSAAESRLHAKRGSYGLGKLEFLPPRAPAGWVVSREPILRKRDAKVAFEAYKGAKYLVLDQAGKAISPELRGIRGLLEWRGQNGWVPAW